MAGTDFQAVSVFGVPNPAHGFLDGFVMLVLSILRNSSRVLETDDTIDQGLQEE